MSIGVDIAILSYPIANLNSTLVSDFGVKYVNKYDVEHLISVLKDIVK